MLQDRQVSIEEQQEIQRLLDEGTESLYNELGNEIGTLGSDMTPEDYAKEWIRARRHEFQNLICIQGNYCAFIAEHKNIDAVELVAALGDIIATKYGLYPVHTIATICIRLSLGSLCECD